MFTIRTSDGIEFNEYNDRPWFDDYADAMREAIELTRGAHLLFCEILDEQWNVLDRLSYEGN